ncbi:thioredoxin-disulfide reductase [Bellilinea caldifistulae]|uniref:thioredoxin-disulfide reductase n=1 Tax=Bellilinea caldifistulae TaxID=360411 RepID=UPI0009E22AAF|nr:thioredoxin-disulfide reductase [Bellilinea caldifistulae]GAP10566.1 thioredoxin-disulfide reductase [Bellilinea caldifistulae]
MEFNLSEVGLGKSSKKESKVEKVLILGAGPAGLSAALYAARAELSPLVLTGTEMGGQASLTHTIENYPGFPEGIAGAELGELFRQQAERFGARFEYDLATAVDLSQRPFKVRTYSNEYLAETLIIATGASPNHLNVPKESELTGRGVSYCATCDGWFFKDKKVVVVGGGDSALEEGLFLTRYATDVTVIHRRDQLRAGAILQKRARENPKIHFIWDTVVSEILGNGVVNGVRLKNVKTGETRDLETDGVFIFIGHTPNTQLFQGQLDMTPQGYIVTDMQMRTSVEGVFAAGEVMDPHYRQVVTSAGMGAAAAIEATRFLEAHSSE